MIIKRLDSMDSKLAQLDSIQTSVNTVNTRLSSMDKKSDTLKAKCVKSNKVENLTAKH